ncbi:MAG: hydroxymethylbilane synthase [Microscillaceae bacterium]|jgi:hydroxymethylbilane synthase|nr:hydroxymethylbilane synthase [Microscillaceae bacterium]
MLIKIGTRGSQLALWQAHFIAEILQKNDIQTEIIAIETKGDKILHKSLAKIGSKGVFTAELEEQLHNHTIDIAVHSAKDVQSELAEGLELIAFTEREIANDVVISFNKNARLSQFDSTYLVGTSSTRRVAMLRHYYPNVRTSDVRGNLQNRMKKLEKGDFDALILAYAGVKRMKFDQYIVEEMPLDTFTPAVGQGSIAIECSTDLALEKREAVRALVNHSLTETCLLAERAFLRTLQGGCSVPVFGLAQMLDNQLKINGGIISLNGKNMLREELLGNPSDAVQIGTQLAQTLIEAGADKILQEIKGTV